MIDELIRKSDVIATLNNWLEGEETETLFGIGYSGAVRDIIKLIETEKPVNAVELPCKIGDTVYEVIEECGAKGSFDCAYNGGHGYSRCRGRFAGKCEAYIQETHFVLSDFGYVGERIFLTREEAEKALEDLKNG